jgi:SAM-dependent methyltransferase
MPLLQHGRVSRPYALETVDRNQSVGMLSRLRCPVCHDNQFDEKPDALLCLACNVRYEMVDGVPALFRPDNPLFSARSSQRVESAGFSGSTIGRWLPNPTLLHRAVHGWEGRLLGHIPNTTRPTRCLVVGSGDSDTMNATLASHFDEIVVSDVVLSPGVNCLCDAHDIPFEDDTFDAVVLTAVLEHVLDPGRIVAEVERVLRIQGVVMAATPFMQQVHMAGNDFQRFTELGTDGCSGTSPSWKKAS